MAITEDRIHVPDTLEELRTEPRPPARRPPRRRLDPATHARALGVAWVVIFSAVLATEPPPPEPEAAIPLYAWVVFSVFILALLPALGGLFAGKSWAYTPSIIAGASGLLLAVGCIADHHGVGAWAILQLGGFTALTGWSVAARLAR